MQESKMKVGDWIYFKIKRSRYAVPNRIERRILNGFFGPDKRPTVRYGGYSEFILYHDEVIRTEKRQ